MNDTLAKSEIKAILGDVMGKEKIFTIHFFSSYIYVMTLVVTVLQAPSVFVLSTLCNMEYCTQYVLPFNTTV